MVVWFQRTFQSPPSFRLLFWVFIFNIFINLVAVVDSYETRSLPDQASLKCTSLQWNVKGPADPSEVPLFLSFSVGLAGSSSVSYQADQGFEVKQFKAEEMPHKVLFKNERHVPTLACRVGLMCSRAPPILV